MNSRLRSACVAALFIAVTIGMTWPQARFMGTRVYDADDPLLSIWRISWIAHILPRSPLDLFNGNIFYPERRTLAYTDSVLLQGLVTAPLIWSGGSRVAAYNLLLLLSIALSGWAMWKYAAHLANDGAAALLAGIVFAFVPYRFDHFGHLELQAAMFLPLTLLYFDRAITTGSRRDAWLAMAMFVAQVYSCIYYSIFLATALVPVAAWRLSKAPPDVRMRFLNEMVPPVFVAMLAVAPYAVAYSANRESLGERLERDVLLYSASLTNYLATPEYNVMYGDWGRSLGVPERFLFPGVLALALALIGALKIDRQRVTLLIVGATGFIISLGLHSPLFQVLRVIAFPYRGLRAPARASILVFLALAALVALAWARVLRGKPRRLAYALTALMSLAMLAEYRTRMDGWLTLPSKPAEVYQWLASQPRAVVAEVPFARADSLHDIADGLYMFNSTWHWQPIVNGYSGFFPPTFYDLARQTRNFPDEHSIDYLKSRGVDLIVVHAGLMDRDAVGAMTAALLARPDIEAMAQFEEPHGPDVVFRLRR
jgi:hypothetical protein